MKPYQDSVKEILEQPTRCRQAAVRGVQLTSLVPVEGTPGLGVGSSWWFGCLLVVTGFLVFSDPLLSQMLCLKRNEGSSVRWQQKRSSFIPCSYCVGRVRFSDTELSFLLEESCRQEGSRSVWEHCHSYAIPSDPQATQNLPGHTSLTCCDLVMR